MEHSSLWPPDNSDFSQMLRKKNSQAFLFNIQLYMKLTFDYAHNTTVIKYNYLGKYRIVQTRGESRK